MQNLMIKYPSIVKSRSSVTVRASEDYNINIRIENILTHVKGYIKLFLFITCPIRIYLERFGTHLGILIVFDNSSLKLFNSSRVLSDFSIFLFNSVLNSSSSSIRLEL